jgi:hypothetical protein
VQPTSREGNDYVVPTPAVVRDATGQRWVFVKGTDNALWARRSNAAWFSLGGHLSSGPSAAVGPGGGISVVVRGRDGASWLIRKPATGEWGPWENLGGLSG